jgi:hypothetical protein
MLSALSSTFDHPEPFDSSASEPEQEAPTGNSSNSSNTGNASWERSQPVLARPFTASFDTAEISRVGSLKVQQRCIRATLDTDSIESLAPRPLARPFRKALDDADLDAPPDPPRYLRLTLD